MQAGRGSHGDERVETKQVDLAAFQIRHQRLAYTKELMGIREKN